MARDSMPRRFAPKKALIVATGTDLVEIHRIQDLLRRRGRRFLDRVYRRAERDYCMSRPRPAESLAARFAAKEAAMKCLGTGWTDGVGFRDVEVTRSAAGAVGLALHGAAAARAARLGISRMHLSLSHSDALALAFVVAVDDG